MSMRSPVPGTLRKTRLRACLCFAAFLLIATTTMAQRFQHPSIPFTKYDLEQLRANINQEPWRTGYNALAADSRSKLSYGMQGPFTEVSRAPNLNNTKWISDMIAIHNLTFMWVFTNDSAYARKATNILDAWAVTNTVWSGNESMLDIGDYVPYMVTAADILRGTFPGWSETNTAHVKKYFADVIWPHSWVPYPLRDNNKGALQCDIALAIAAFLDDKAKWDQAIEVFRLDATAALRCSLPNGEVGDAGRDDHWFVQAFALMWAAEVAWKQGIDLYSEYGNRLHAIGELYNKYSFAGDTMTFIPFGGSAVYWQNWGIRPGVRHQHPFNNLIKGAYDLRMGIATPWTEQMRTAVGEGGFSFLYLKSADTSTAVPLSPIIFPTTTPASDLSNIDIGNPGIAGSAVYSSGKWMLNGAGNSAATAANFAFKPVSGDFMIIAKIDSNTISSATSGVMMRDGLSAASNSIAVNLYNGSVNTRRNGNVSGYTHYAPKAPWWLKLERIGNRIFSYHSADGIHWTCHNLIYASFANDVYAGVFTASNNTSALNTAAFSTVSVTNTTPAGAPQISSALSVVSTVGTTFNYSITATNDPASYSADGLPEGLSIDATTGIISGIPTTPGTTAVTINATNANGTGTAVLILHVNSNVTPAAPAGLTATIVNTTSISLSWTALPGVSSYSVKRSLTAGGPYTSIQTGITGTTFTDPHPAYEVNNYYVVTALSGNLESGNSNEVFANVPPAIPSKPVVVSRNNELDLHWDAADGAVTYKVKRATIAGGPYTVIAQLAATSYTDLQVANGTGYYYVISSMGNTLESANSIESFGVPGSNASTWSGAPASGTWNNASNWVEGTVPASPAILTFKSTTDSVLTNDLTGLQVSRLMFDTTASDYTIDGNSISLKTDLVNISSYRQAINLPVVIDSQVTVSAVSRIDLTGTVSGTGSLLKTGGGVLQLTGKNTYTGNTILNGSIAIAGTGTGTSGNPTSGPLGTGKIIMDGGTLYSGDSAATIYNDIYVAPDKKSFLTQSVNSITIYGRLTGSGTLWEDGNDYPGINLYGDNSGFTGTFVAALRSGRNRVRFMVPESGSANAYWNLDANGIDCIGIHFKTGTLHFGALTGRGYFRNDAGGTPTISIGALNLNTNFGGTMNNFFNVVKVGTGTLSFSGNHTYGGTTTVTNGKFLLNNSSANGTFSSQVVVEAGVFGGTGRSQAPVKVGTGNGAGASLEPGNTGIGTLTTTAALTMNGDATYNAELSIQNATADKISANGVTLNVPALAVNGIDSGALASGTNFVIIDNAGNNAVTGTFRDLPELALVQVKGYNLRITYRGGDGNDVALLDDRVLPVTISSKTADTALLGRPYSYIIAGIKSPTSFNATGLPEGLTVDISTGIISGVPAVAGLYSVNLTAANDTSSGTAVLTLFVRNTTVDGVTAIAGTGKNTIEWNQVLNLGYRIKRGTAAEGPFTMLDSTYASFYVDSSITAGVTYYYVLAAYDSTGEFGNSTAVTPVVTTGAYSYWSFNDSSAITANDLWGNRQATLNSGVTRVAGAVKQGIKLDGTANAYASLPAGAVSSLADFTIAGWVKLDAAANWTRIFDFGSGTNIYMYLARNNTGLLRYAITTGGGSKEQGINSNMPVRTGVYTHFAVSWSGNVGILYMNGQEVGRNTGMTLKPSNLGNTTQNWFGRSQYSADPKLNGVLDDIRIYNRPLSATEIVSLVNDAAPSQPTALTVPAASSKNIQLTWTASTGAASYNIKRSTTNGSGYTTIASGITAASYTDTTVTGGGPYYYIVTARSGLFESAPSNQVTVLLAPAAVGYPIATSWNKRIDLSWTSAAGATSYMVTRTTGADTTTIATVTGLTYSDTSVTNGTAYSYIVYAVNTAGMGAAGAVATATPVNEPNSWSHRDIGSTVLTGNAGYENGITAYGAGADIWGNADAFHFTYQSLSGDGAIVARVSSLKNYATGTAIHGSAKAGVMVREFLTAGSRHGLVNVTPAGGVEFIKRTSNNGSSSAIGASGAAMPYWIKVQRSKDTLTAFRSADGVNWTTTGSQIYGTLAGNVYIGLAVCSHNTAAITQGVFDTVSLATDVPVITSAKTATAIADSTFSFRLTATNATYRFTATGLPGGLSINTATGVISGAPVSSGTFPVVVTATNALGMATDTLVMTVYKAPTIITRNIEVAVGHDGTASITAQQVDSGSVSYTGTLTLSIDRTNFTCADIGSPVTVSLTGTDSLGLGSSATAQVTVIDNTAPIVTAPQDQFFCYNNDGTYAFAALTTTDNCGIASISYVISGATSRAGTGTDAGGAYNTGTSTVIWTVNDVHGNVTADTTNVIVNPALGATIADVFAMNPAIDDTNTIYIGYGPASLNITATPNGGASPYRYSWNTGDSMPSIAVSNAGTYTAIITDSKGCTATASIEMKTVDVRCGNGNDKVMICHNDKTICISEADVQDHLDHGDRLGGCNAVLNRFSNSGTVIDGNTAMIKVYPNPVMETLNIQTGTNTGAVMQLYNSSGLLVATERLTNSTTTLSVKTLPAGIYYVRIKSGAAAITHKIIKL